MALEYVEGRNLREFLMRKGPPELMLALSIMRQAASALSRASELGIIHRDIKPENILLTRKGEVKIADFGLSRNTLPDQQPALNLTQSGITMGTPLYMSPEQVEGKTVDCRTDIYSLGITCFHMLAGHPPYQGANAFDVALQHVRGEVPQLAAIRPDLPEPLCAIIQKMMARDAEQRYQTGRELLRDLNQLRDNSSLQTASQTQRHITVELVPTDQSQTPSFQSSPTLTNLQVPSRRHLWFWLTYAGSLILALFLGAAIASAVRRPTPVREAAPAEAIPEKKASEEESLRTLLEPFLTKQDKDALRFEPAFGQKLCQELGVLLLKEKRYDEAEALFRRLEKLDLPQYTNPIKLQFQNMGKLNLAVVLGLRDTRDKASQSNKYFQELAQPTGPGVLASVPLEQVLRAWWPITAGNAKRDLPFRAFLVQALQNNKRNGVPEDKVPQILKDLRDGKKAAK